MPANSETLDPRSSLIEDLISRQDDVIRQLDELDSKLLAAIESIRPSKENAEDQPALFKEKEAQANSELLRANRKAA